MMYILMIEKIRVMYIAFATKHNYTWSLLTQSRQLGTTNILIIAPLSGLLRILTKMAVKFKIIRSVFILSVAN